MWRNYEEDWERRKSYLIRSLFHDIPLLSPVPEDQETRSDLGSPSSVLPFRPHSPLPPLIVERVPNRHDHPDQYYKDLEEKMKKLYRKLFYDEKSSSIENLIDLYRSDNDIQSLITNQLDDYAEKSVSSILEQDSVDDDLVTIKAPETALSERSSSLATEGDKSDNGINSSLEEHSFVTTQKNRKLRSSIESEEATHVTAEVIVHRVGLQEHEARVQDKIDGEMQRIHESIDEEIQTSPVYEDNDISKSPILGSSQLNIKEVSQHSTSIDEIENSLHEQIPPHSSGDLCSEVDDSKSVSKEKDYESSASDITLEGIEIMRRQRGVSPSLGSLQGEHLEYTDGSTSYTNIDIIRKPSFEIDTDVESSDAENSKAAEVQENIASYEMPADFLEILTTSTPNFSPESKRSDLSISAELRKRQSNGQRVDQTQCFRKRKKFENIAIQTSDNEEISWDTLKRNLFVGAAKIYRLCSCKDHNC